MASSISMNTIGAKWFDVLLVLYSSRLYLPPMEARLHG